MCYLCWAEHYGDVDEMDWDGEDTELQGQGSEYAEADEPIHSMDPVQAFFSYLCVTARQSTSLTETRNEVNFEEMQEIWMDAFTSRTSTDPDAAEIEELVESAEEAYSSWQWLFQGLMRLSLSKQIADDDASLKARHLRFFRWIAQGRKDETAVFEPGSSAERLMAPPSKAHLPDRPRRCAKCRRGQAKLGCPGCRLQTDGKTTFAVTYCSSTCRRQHWKEHKEHCLQTRRLFRAVSLFQEIFEHFMAVTYPGACPPESVVEVNGILFVELDEDSPIETTPRTEMLRFPPDLAPSQDAFRAAVTIVGQYALFTQARELLKLLIRPCVEDICKYNFEPKNMHRPVCFRTIGHDYHSSAETHEAIFVTLPCGDDFVIDPLGIRHGWKEIVAPAREYRWVREHHHEAYFSPDFDLEDRLGFHDEEYFCAPLLETPRDIMKTVVAELQQQINKKYDSVRSFLDLCDIQFAGARDAVAATAKKGLDFLADEISKSAVPEAVTFNQPKWGRKDRETIWYRTRRASVESVPDWVLAKAWDIRWKPVMKISWPKDDEGWDSEEDDSEEYDTAEFDSEQDEEGAEDDMNEGKEQRNESILKYVDFIR